MKFLLKIDLVKISYKLLIISKSYSLLVTKIYMLESWFYISDVLRLILIIFSN
jgi:hypothetical protein